MIARHVQITIFVLLLGVLAGGIYMNRLKQREQSAAQTNSDSLPVTAPVAGPTEKIELMIAYDEDGVLRKEQSSAALPQEAMARDKKILRLLLSEYLRKPSPHPLGNGADVNDVYLVPGGLCVVDLNAAFAEGHRSGIMVEQMTIASIVETLSFNDRTITKVKFLVDGKERETLAGHADLSMIYEVPAVHEMVAELQVR
jgi:hypothetical protein